MGPQAGEALVPTRETQGWRWELRVSLLIVNIDNCVKVGMGEEGGKARGGGEGRGTGLQVPHRSLITVHRSRTPRTRHLNHGLVFCLVAGGLQGDQTSYHRLRKRRGGGRVMSV